MSDTPTIVEPAALRRLLAAPAAEVLASRGVRFDAVVGQGRERLRLAPCPACGRAGCLVEREHDQAPYRFLCLHPHLTTGGGAPCFTYPDLLTRVGALPAAGPAGECPEGSERAPGNPEELARRARRLRSHPAAMAYLVENGVSGRAVAHFGLGLSGSRYSGRAGELTGDALTAPLIDAAGRRLGKYVYLAVPGTTAGAGQKPAWMSGPACCYHSGAATEPRGRLVVCGSLLELWAVWDLLADSTHDLLLAVRTPGADWPPEWRSPIYWQSWQVVYLAHGDDGAARETVALMDGPRRARRLRPPEGLPGWTRWRAAGLGATRWLGLLAAAPTMAAEAALAGRCGRMSYRPVDLLGDVHGGHLYAAVSALRLVPDKDGRAPGTGQLESVLIRSDRTEQRVVALPPPAGGGGDGGGGPLWILESDPGLQVHEPPRPSPHSSWSWESAERYLAGESRPRPLAQLVREIGDYLRASVWLPCPEEYLLLALTAAASFATAVWDAVGFVLVHGPKGSGKSQLGAALTRVSANSCAYGAINAANVARAIDLTRGLIVMDDLESIGAKGRGGQAGFSDLTQILKVSYAKATAVRVWSDPAAGYRQRRLNFFGFKVFTNTQGADAILGSRCFLVHTRSLPEGAVAPRGPHHRPTAETDALRDEMHTWVFEHAREITATYAALYGERADRSQEIAAPLRVMAALTGDGAIGRELDRALEAQERGRAGTPAEDPVAELSAALRSLIRQGYEEVTPDHVALEMQGGGHDRLGLADRPRPNHRWIQAQLVARGIIEPRRTTRRRVRELGGRQLRVYTLRADYLRAVRQAIREGEDMDEGAWLKMVGSRRDPLGFCGGCVGCAHATKGCGLMPFRLREDSHLGAEYSFRE